MPPDSGVPVVLPVDHRMPWVAPRDATSTTPTTLAARAQDHLAENPCVDVDVHL